MRFRDFSAGAGGPHNGQETQEIGQDGHVLGAQAVQGALDDGGVEVFPGIEATLGPAFIMGDIEVQDVRIPVSASRARPGPTYRRSLRH